MRAGARRRGTAQGGPREEHSDPDVGGRQTASCAGGPRRVRPRARGAPRPSSARIRLCAHRDAARPARPRVRETKEW